MPMEVDSRQEPELFGNHHQAAPELVYLPTETRPYVIRNRDNDEFIAEIEIPLLISDRLMEEEVMYKVWVDGYFLPSVFSVERVIQEVRYGIRTLEEDVDYILRDAEYEIQLIQKQTAEIIRLTEEHQARKNRRWQPRSLLSMAGQVGPTQINAIINKDLVGPFGI